MAMKPACLLQVTISLVYSCRSLHAVAYSIFLTSFLTSSFFDKPTKLARFKFLSALAFSLLLPVCLRHRVSKPLVALKPLLHIVFL